MARSLLIPIRLALMDRSVVVNHQLLVEESLMRTLLSFAVLLSAAMPVLADPIPVPEPESLSLFALAGVAMAVALFRKH